MGVNPVETKAEAPTAADVLAAAAGVPTPAQAKGLWRYRKLALILGGAGLAAAAGGYGYKYISVVPGKANAQTDPPAVARDDAPKPPPPGADEPVVRPPAGPVKDDAPAVPDVKLPDMKIPVVEAPVIKPAVPPPAPAGGKSEIELPPLVVPPGDKKEPTKTDDPPVVAPPPAVPELKLPATDKKKPAADAGDTFKAADAVPTEKTTRPAPLPADVTQKKEKPKAGGPVLPVDGTDVPKVEVPVVPKADVKVEVPAAPKVEAPAPGKADPAPMIPKLDIDLPPPPAGEKKNESPVIPPPPGGEKKPDVPAVAPPPGGKDDVPTISAPPIVVPGPKSDVPPVVVSPMKDKGPEVKTPEVKSPDVPTIKIPGPGTPAVNNDPPPIPMHDPKVPTIGAKADVPPVAAPKKDSYDELWHDDHGEPYAAISREYFHDAKYAAALEAYNRRRRKPGDKIIRVPPTWVLEEQFPDLVRDRAGSERKPTGGGLKFEPVAPLPPSSGRPAPPATEASRSTDEYRVTAETGETIREVARKALGDANQWRKLEKLNPDVDPTLPIPAGTVLRIK